MTQKKSPSADDQAFVARYERLSDEVPPDDAEADEILKAEGIDIDAAFQQTLMHIAEVDARLRSERWARAEAERQAALTSMQISRPERNRSELIAQVNEFKTREGAQAYFRGLEEMPDEDLEQLVAQLEELSKRDGQKE